MRRVTGDGQAELGEIDSGTRDREALNGLITAASERGKANEDRDRPGEARYMEDRPSEIPNSNGYSIHLRSPRAR